MAVRIYSDVTKKFYDDEAAALKAEKELETKRTEAAECRKKMAQEVEEKRQALTRAREEYYKALEAFCDKYGAYHVSIGKMGDWEKIWDSFFNW